MPSDTLENNNAAIVIAIPKGRVLKQLLPRFASAELPTDSLANDSRKLIRDSKNDQIRYLLLKPDDVPTYVEYGVADLGVVGRDVLRERSYDVYVPVDLGIGKCSMKVCGRPGTQVEAFDRRPLRVATKFPNIASDYFAKKGRPAELIFVQGSVELAPLMGLADVIVDLVETGETLRENGLVPLEHIFDVSSVLIANRSSLKLKRQRVAPIIDKLGAS